jgi:hypothetical protein
MISLALEWCIPEKKFYHSLLSLTEIANNTEKQAVDVFHFHLLIGRKMLRDISSMNSQKSSVPFSEELLRVLHQQISRREDDDTSFFFFCRFSFVIFEQI